MLHTSQPRFTRDLLGAYAFLFSIATVIVVVDQWTKLWVRTNINLGGVWQPDHWLTPYARLVYWKNTGAAFGIFQDNNTIFAVLAIFVTLLIINYFPIIPRADWFFRVALALQMGGAVGNLIDRVTLEYVTDFVSILYFPVFNIADLAITIGVILIFLPILPDLPREMAHSKLLNRSRKINRTRADQAFHAGYTKPDEPIMLGTAEVIMRHIPATRMYTLKLDAKRIRRRYLARRFPPTHG